MADDQLIGARCCVECGTAFEVPVRCGRPRQRCEECSPHRPGQRHRQKTGRGNKDKGCVCQVCGSAFLSRKSSTAVCGEACRWRLKNANGRTRAEILADKRAASPMYRDHICEGCGSTFRPKGADRTRYCSRDCFFASAALRKEERARQQIAAVPQLECIECSAPIVGRVRKVCGNECRKAIARRKGRERHARERAARVLEPRECEGCGQSFAPDHAARIYCTDLCGRRVTRRVRRGIERARLRSARVEPVKARRVFIRDGWRCQDCGCKTPERLRGTISPKAPELDHIVPLSKGGEHSYLNTQCLCRACNGMKSNTARGQLRLFG
jgi:5-methylcytosine-specific restriction endonuclease McrA